MDNVFTGIYKISQEFINSAMDFLEKIYGLLAKILPDIVLFSGQNAWWHNMLVGILWLVIYLAVGLLYKLLFTKQKDLMEKTAQKKYECVLFAWWQILFYCIAILIPFIIYFTAQSAWLNIIIGFPLLCGWIYFFIKAGTKAGFLIIRQVYIVILFCFGCFIFAPFAIAFFLITGISFCLLHRHRKNSKKTREKVLEDIIIEEKNEETIKDDNELKPLL